ncbi:hypothetical protein Tco_0687637 [Tanacetum coccineum]
MKLSLETPQEKGEGEGDDADLERAIKLSLDPALLPQGRAPVGGVTIREPGSEATPKLQEVVGKGKAVVTEEQVLIPVTLSSEEKNYRSCLSSSTSDSERTESDTESGTPKGDKVQGEIVSSTVTSGVSIPVSVPEKAHVAQAGPHPEPMQEDQTGSDTGKLTCGLLAGPNPKHMDDEFLATAYPKVHENLKLITDERVIDDKPEKDDQEKSKAREEFDSNIPDSSHQTVTSTPPVIAPFTTVTISEPSLLVTPPPINTEATTITTSLPEITPFIALQLRVARLEQEMSEVKKTDVLASIRSQVPTATPKEIIKPKEQGEEKQDSTYSIRSTDKVDLEEFDLKSALFKHMNKKKPSENHKEEQIVRYEEMMMKRPSAGSNQGRSTKKRRSDSAASGSAKPPPKDDDQSSQKPRESDASASKQHPSFTSTGWQITDTRDTGADSSMHKSDPESEHSEQSSDDISKQIKGMIRH